MRATQSVSFKPDVLRQARAAAADDARTFSSYVEKLVRADLAAKGRINTEPQIRFARRPRAKKEAA